MRPEISITFGDMGRELGSRWKKLSQVRKDKFKPGFSVGIPIDFLFFVPICVTSNADPNSVNMVVFKVHVRE